MTAAGATIAAVSVRSVTKQFDTVTALKNVFLDIARSEFFVARTFGMREDHVIADYWGIRDADILRDPDRRQECRR